MQQTKDISIKWKNTTNNQDQEQRRNQNETKLFWNVNKKKRNLLMRLTDGLFGSPTRCPHVVSKLTRHSRTRPWDIQGLFHPLSGAVSAGDKLVLRLGEFGVPLMVEFEGWLIFAWVLTFVSKSGFNNNRRPISGVWETSNENSIVLPASSFLQNTSESL